jgi:hypothetical protein
MKRTPLERRTPLRRVSLKRQRVNRERRELVRDQLTQRPWCEAGETIRAHWTARFGATSSHRLATASTWACQGRSVDIHEPLTRARGGSILDVANTVAVCRGCHDWIHDHPESATRLGLLKGSAK